MYKSSARPKAERDPENIVLIILNVLGLTLATLIGIPVGLSIFSTFFGGM